MEHGDFDPDPESAQVDLTRWEHAERRGTKQRKATNKRPCNVIGRNREKEKRPDPSPDARLLTTIIIFARRCGERTSR